MPSREVVDRAVELLRQSANYQYFFDQLRTPDWIEPLHERGFFRNPPDPIREDGYVRFPIWVESRYLARVAAQAPDLVARILRQLPSTENARVHDDVVEAACHLPASVAASLAPQVISYLESPYHFLLPEKVKDLITHLARGAELSAAVDLARALLRPSLPAPREVQGFVLPEDPRPRFRHPAYDEVLAESLSAIREVDPVTAYRLAADLLDATLAGGDSAADHSQDYSYIWLPSIEEGPRNPKHPDVRADLVRAVRDLVDGTETDIPALLEDLDGREWPIFRRLALHLLRVRLQEFPDVARERVADIARLVEPHEYHEFVLLLRDVLAVSATDERERMLDDIISVYSGVGERSEDERRSKYRLARTLGALGGALPTRGRELLTELLRDLDLTSEALASPDYLTSDSGGAWIGPTSPLSPDDILGTPDAELVRYLATWSPPESWRAPSPEGLGRSLTEAAHQEPRRFARLAREFVGLDPTYVRALIRGLRDVLGNGMSFDWRPALELGLWVVGQSDPEPRNGGDRERDPNWSWTRRALADLVSEGLVIRENAVTFDQRETVWALLTRLLEDPDPTPEHEEQYGGSNMDPATLAINTVRGEALHALVRYALWVRQSLGEDRTAGLDDMPEVREALDRHLDPERDPSVAIRSAYGQFFPWLHLVDAEWAASRVRRIFPFDHGATPWFDAAWHAYIVFTQPFDSMAEVLRDVYAEAIERLPLQSSAEQSRLDPSAHLAEHLAVFVAHGVLTPEDALVVRFFELASPALRGHVHQFLGRSFRLAEPSKAALRRSTALWDARLAMSGDPPVGESKELEAFGWWFAVSAVDAAWRVANLLDVLRRTGGRIEYPSLVLEELANLAERYPAEALSAVQQIVRATDETWEIVAGREHIRTVLLAGLGDAATRESAEVLTHELGARGYSEFRSVLKRG